MDSNLVMWGLVVGFLMPPLLAIVQQPGWSTGLRSVVMFVASLIAGAGTVYFTGDFDISNPDKIITTVLVVMVTAISTYKGLWQTTNIAPKIEAATSPKASDS
jgi:uncharacterized membrane protein